MRWGDEAASLWPVSGTIDNCYFKHDTPGAAAVHIDVQRGTNLRINDPYLVGESATTGIRISNNPNNRNIMIDDVFSDFIPTAQKVVDPGKLLKRISTAPYYP